MMGRSKAVPYSYLRGFIDYGGILPSPPVPPKQHQGDGNGSGSSWNHPDRHNRGEVGGKPGHQTQGRGNLRVTAYDIPAPAVKAVAKLRHSTQTNFRA